MKKILLLAIMLMFIAANASAAPIFGQTFSGITVGDLSDSDLDVEVEIEGVLIGYTARYPYNSEYPNDYYTGLYIGTLTASSTSTLNQLNNDVALWNTIFGFFLGDTSYTSDWAKIDGGIEDDSRLVITYLGDTNGTWSTEASDPPIGVSFYALKSGSAGVALYYVDPVLNSGYWTTRHILNAAGNQPELSHFVADLTPMAPVPEPATLLLLGTGLVGLVGVGRKKLKK